MDQSTLLKIARLRTLAARHGKAFDVVRFATDRSFAQQTLQQVLDTDNEELLLAGLALMDALQMVSVGQSPPAAPAPAVAPEPAPPSPSKDRYIGRLR
jgi:hypothetical protein